MSGHTPGPWQWEETPGGDVRLATPDRGKLYVMGFARKGMRGAQPRFSLWGDGPRERRGGIMHDFNEAGGANHPDARLIAAAPELLEALQEMVRWYGRRETKSMALSACEGLLPIEMQDQEVQDAMRAIAKATGAAE